MKPAPFLLPRLTASRGKYSYCVKVQLCQVTVQTPEQNDVRSCFYCVLRIRFRIRAVGSAVSCRGYPGLPSVVCSR